MSIDNEVEQTEMSEIDKKILGLSLEERRKFDKRLDDVCHNEIWLEALHNFRYGNLDEQGIRETLYREEFAKKPGGTDGEEGVEAYGRMFNRYGDNLKFF